MAVIKAVSSKAGIGQALDYVTKEEKTEDKLVSGLHCEPDTVKDEMQATKELWGKTGGRTYKHFVQSYHEDEHITPEQAHKNAVELAKNTEAWKGHEVLIATHIDRGHIHSHFIVNSVNYENVCAIHSPKRAAMKRSAMAAPSAMAWPCPNGPDVFSTPRITSTSGCPGVTLPHWRSDCRSSVE